MTPAFFLLMAAVLAVITALTHSVLGEKMLLRPLLASNAGPMENPLARQVTRLAWHWTTLLWLGVAAVLALAAYGEIEQPYLVLAIGVAHLVVGLIDLVWTRARHIGAPLIFITGGLVLLAYYLTL